MNETNSPKCPRCGATLPANAPEGLCPRCVVAANLSAETEVNTGDIGPGGTVVVKPAPAPPPPAEEIAKLFPQLEILATLGRGGMGAVYKARQPRLDRFVALKILSSEKKGDPQFAERFEREARTLARLHHPNIVAIYDFGETQGVFYLLMEFVDGLTLRQLLQTRKLTPEEALVIVPKICEALQYAHQQGVVHRDIKPENILLDKQGQVKIADFGIAKIVGQAAQTGLTQDQQVIGTPHYMAPEQVERPQTVDHRADIYSLGVVLYEMLTSELPLGKFAPPSRKVQVDVRLDEVVLRALEKEPDRRYQQARQVKTDMETISSGSKALPPVAGVSFASSADESDKRILPAFLLAFFFGIFGAHRFYVGKIWTGLLQLGAVAAWVLMIIGCATTGSRFQPELGILLGFTIFGSIIMATIDWILIACRAFTDGRGRRLTHWVNPKFESASIGSGNSPSASAVPPVFSSTASSTTSPQSPAPNQPPIQPTSGGATKLPSHGKIIAPGVALMIAGMWILFHAIVGLVFLAGWQLPIPNFMNLPGFGHHWGAIANTSIVVFQIIPSFLILFGGSQMARVGSYAWSVAAAILSIVACSWVGFPVGIWAVIVLMQPDVKEAFAKPANQPSSGPRLWPWIVGSTALLVLALMAAGTLALVRSIARPASNRIAVTSVDADGSGIIELADETPSVSALTDDTNNPPSATNAVKRTVRSGTARNFSKTLAFAPGGTLTMKVDRGDIRITGSDAEEVQVRVSREITHADAALASRIIQEHQIELRQNDNEFSINAQEPPSLGADRWSAFSKHPVLNVHYELSVPRQCDVKLETSGGDVTVSDLRGDLKAKTMGGTLTFDAIAGKVDGQTMGGDVRASKCESDLLLDTAGGTITVQEFTGPFVRASTLGGEISAEFASKPKGDSDLHTNGGNVSVRLPGDSAFTLDAQTLGGSVTSDFSVLTSGKHEGSTLRGKANGGGPLLKLHTMGGDINVLTR